MKIEIVKELPELKKVHVTIPKAHEVTNIRAYEVLQDSKGNYECFATLKGVFIRTSFSQN